MYPPRVQQDLDVGPRGNSPVCWLYEPSLSAISGWGSAGDHCFCSQAVGVEYTEGFLTREWDAILLGCGGTSTLARGPTFSAQWLHEPQPISD